jgi:hypothetical protein
VTRGIRSIAPIEYSSTSRDSGSGTEVQPAEKMPARAGARLRARCPRDCRVSVHLRNVRHRSGRPRLRAALLPPQRSTIRQSELELFASGAQGRQLVCAWPSHPGEPATSLLPYVPYGSMFASCRAIHVTQQHAIQTNFVGVRLFAQEFAFRLAKKKG